MSRTRKFRSAEEVLSFGDAPTSSRYQVPLALTPEELEQSLRRERQRHYEEDQRRYNSVGSYRVSYNDIRKSNLSEYVGTLVRKQLEVSTGAPLVSSVRWLFHNSKFELRGKASRDHYFFSFHALNEFLAQDEYEVYGDFLEEHWDRCFEAAETSKLTSYPHTEKLAERYDDDFILAHRKSTTVAQRKLIEETTKDTLEKFVTTFTLSELSVPANSIEARMKVLLTKIQGTGLQQEALQPRELTNLLFGAFLKAGAGYEPGPRANYLNLLTTLGELLPAIQSKYTAEEAKATPTQPHTNLVAPLVRFLYSEGSKFSIQEMLCAIRMLKMAEFTRGGNYGDNISFLVELLQEEKRIDILKLVAASVLYNTGNAPTVKEWRAALQEGHLAMDAVGVQTFLLLITKSEAKNPKITQELQLFQKLVGTL